MNKAEHDEYGDGYSVVEPRRIELVVERVVETTLPIEEIQRTLNKEVIIRPSFLVPRERLCQWHRRASRSLGHAVPELSRYYRVELGATGELARDYQTALAAALLLNESQLGLRATVASRPSVPRLRAANLGSYPGDLTHKQGYLDAVGAKSAWALPGGDGQAIQVCDCEMGFDAAHEDLAFEGPYCSGSRVAVVSSRGNNLSLYDEHGTSTLGVVGAVDNGWGLTGICYSSELLFASESGNCRPQCIADAIAALCYGDVLLLEMQGLGGPTAVEVPAEFDADVWAALQTAAGLGILVVSAAGNGCIDLGKVNDPLRGRPWDLGSAGYLDSLAVIVGAGSPSTQTWLPRSNYGERLNCQGWGEQVWTCLHTAAGGPRLFYGNFDGTSSATAIVAGVAACVQGRAKAKLGRPMPPQLVRSLLSCSANGSLQPPADAARNPIGPLPNLEKLFRNSGLA